MKRSAGKVSLGAVVAVSGSVVDIGFDEHLPPIPSLLQAGDEGEIVIEVLSKRDARLEDARFPSQGLFAVPTSVQGITSLVGRILVESESRYSRVEGNELYLFYNRPAAGAVYESVNRRLLEELGGAFHRLRQSGIDEELFDVISGFEELNLGEK